MKYAFVLGLLLLAPLAGCAGPPGAVTPAPLAAAPPDPRTQMAALETRIAALTEEERLKLDPAAKPLAFDPELARVARERAADMAQKNYLAHAAPNGDTSATLLMAEDAKWQGLLGENLAAQHYIRQSGVDVDQFAQRFLDEWVQSQPHRENLAFAGYDRTGVGAAVNGDTVYVTQLFASYLNGEPDHAPGAAQFPGPPPGADNTVTPPLPLRGAQGSGGK